MCAGAEADDGDRDEVGLAVTGALGFRTVTSALALALALAAVAAANPRLESQSMSRHSRLILNLFSSSSK